MSGNNIDFNQKPFSQISVDHPWLKAQENQGVNKIFMDKTYPSILDKPYISPEAKKNNNPVAENNIVPVVAGVVGGVLLGTLITLVVIGTLPVSGAILIGLGAAGLLLSSCSITPAPNIQDEITNERNQPKQLIYGFNGGTFTPTGQNEGILHVENKNSSVIITLDNLSTIPTTISFNATNANPFTVGIMSKDNMVKLSDPTALNTLFVKYKTYAPCTDINQTNIVNLDPLTFISSRGNLFPTGITQTSFTIAPDKQHVQVSFSGTTNESLATKLINTNTGNSLVQNTSTISVNNIYGQDLLFSIYDKTAALELLKLPIQRNALLLRQHQWQAFNKAIYSSAPGYSITMSSLLPSGNVYTEGLAMANLVIDETGNKISFTGLANGQSLGTYVIDNNYAAISSSDNLGITLSGVASQRQNVTVVVNDKNGRSLRYKGILIGDGNLSIPISSFIESVEGKNGANAPTRSDDFTAICSLPTNKPGASVLFYNDGAVITPTSSTKIRFTVHRTGALTLTQTLQSLSFNANSKTGLVKMIDSTLNDYVSSTPDADTAIIEIPFSALSGVTISQFGDLSNMELINISNSQLDFTVANYQVDVTGSGPVITQQFFNVFDKNSVSSVGFYYGGTPTLNGSIGNISIGTHTFPILQFGALLDKTTIDAISISSTHNQSVYYGIAVDGTPVNFSYGLYGQQLTNISQLAALGLSLDSSSPKDVYIKFICPEKIFDKGNQ